MAGQFGATPVKSITRDVFAIAGSFAPNGSSAISAASNKGAGWSVAYVSTGLYRVTLADRWYQIVAVTASLQLATADDKDVQIGPISESAKTVDLTVWDGSAAAVADVAANANNRINFVVWVKRTSAKN